MPRLSKHNRGKRLFTIYESDFKGSIFEIICKCGGIVKHDPSNHTLTCANCYNSVTPEALIKNLELF